jgi:hypothetical protein
MLLGLAGIIIAVVLLVIVVIGWTRDEGEPSATTSPATRPAARLVVPGGEARFTQRQRTTKGLPGAAKEAVRLAIGDVTGGKVKVSVTAGAGEKIVEERAVSERERVEFDLDSRKYAIVVEELRNALIGEDEVVFVLREEGEGKRAMTEEEKIERLIGAVRELKGATFIRNGGEHSAADAVEHMRRKYERGKKEITTAREFIAKAGSRSSLSGEAYRIRTADGKEVTAEAFLTKKLDEIEGAGAPATRAASG